MKYLLALLLTMPLFATAQRTYLSAYGSYSFGRASGYDTYGDGQKQDKFGGGIKAGTTFSILQVGVGAEFTGAHGKGKVIGEPRNTPYNMKGKPVYAEGRALTPYLYVNGVKHIMAGKLEVYAGVMGGLAIPNKSKSGAQVVASETTPTDAVLVYTQVKSSGIIMGLQAGAALQLNKHIALTAEVAMRRARYNSNIVATNDYSLVLWRYYDTEVHYAFTYFPASIGVRYMF